MKVRNEPSRSALAWTASASLLVLACLSLQACDPGGKGIDIQDGPIDDGSSPTPGPGSTPGGDDDNSSFGGGATRVISEEQQLAAAQSSLAAANALIARLEAELKSGSSTCRNQTCSEECASLSQTGRWRFGPHGHDCADPISGKVHCHCSSSVDPVAACAEVQQSKARRRLRESQAAKLEAADASRATAAAQTGLGVVTEHVAALADTSAIADVRRLGSPTETISSFCNATGLRQMHGVAGGAEEGPSELNQMESSILADVAEEMEKNNVDKVARDIFSFYVCVRWVPDSIFWQIVEQELAANLVSSVVDHSEELEQAVSELYQKYKYVPLLCSQNLNVFDETDNEDNTYFRHFKKQVDTMSAWFTSHGSDEVGKQLQKVDEIFCGSTNMNDPSCNTLQGLSDWLTSATSFLGNWGLNAQTTKEKWQAMARIFKSFESDVAGASASWSQTVSEWKAQFPFHSFVHKNEGMAASSSPKSHQRYLVCFGKRVASELHRRPAGQHLLTDQNNIGCHGFWDASEVQAMLTRMVELWKPPTCQLAEMVYVMKRHMLRMFAQMNERLFDALPALIMDEDLANKDLLEAHAAGPPPFDPQSAAFGNILFVDGMRVLTKTEIKDPADCSDMIWSSTKCKLSLSKGSFGTVAIVEGSLQVVWDRDSRSKKLPASVDNLEIVPRSWQDTGITASDLVAGVSTIWDGLKSLVDSTLRNRYSSLADLMSGSTSKWVVCPILDGVNHSHLDSQLGVEDAAFQDHQKEAYSKWTGYKAKVPGEDCVIPDFISQADFPDLQVCEISELHADHLEKYTNHTGQLEQFLCPLKASLPAPEQLAVLMEKKGMCLVHMTANQRQHYQWPYNGDYPARRQHDRKPNLPNVEYELIKLLNVPSRSKVSFAKTCSPEELRLQPRFCRAVKLHNPWPSAASLASAMAGAVTGTLGVGASSIASALGDYVELYQSSGDKNGSQLVEESAQLLGEQLWDKLTGAGRLLSSKAQNIASTFSHGLPGAAARDARLEAEIFEEQEAGSLLHSLSYQRSIGSNNRTSNAKERYQRVVAVMPCRDFNPGLEYTLRKSWSNVALKIVQSAFRSLSGGVLDGSVVEFALRGEAVHFLRTNEQTDNDSWTVSGAALTLVNGQAGTSDPPDCAAGLDLSCSPTQSCTWSGWSCVPKTKLSSSGWWSVADRHLVSQVTEEGLNGITATFYCGPKRLFNDTAPGPRTGSSLLQCLQQGVVTNAQIRAKFPWRVYFPDEVIVVAIFGAITESQCKLAQSTASKKTICTGGATEDSALDKHLTGSQKTSTDGVYQGLTTGAGFPRGTPQEVVMRPEDVLEAAGLISRS